jgi:integrase
LTPSLRTWPSFTAGEDGLVFVGNDGRPMLRSAWSGRVWRPAVAAAGLVFSVTFHALRHYYASLLIRHGESVKTVQGRLGHSSAAQTLDVYSHLWPDSDDRTQDAVDAVLRTVADSLRTVEGSKAQNRRSDHPLGQQIRKYKFCHGASGS